MYTVPMFAVLIFDQASPPIFNPATFPRRQAKQTQAKPTMPSAARDTLRTSCGPLYEEISNYNRSLPDPITTDPLGAPALTPDSKQFLITESASSSPQLSNRADTDLSHLPGNIPRLVLLSLVTQRVAYDPGGINVRCPHCGRRVGSRHIDPVGKRTVDFRTV